MTWTQLLTILLTGVLAVGASAVGQYVGGRMALNRDERDRSHRERERFSEPKRELYLQALTSLSEMKPLDFPNKVGTMMSLSLFDPDVAQKFAEVSNAHLAVFSSLDAGMKKLSREIAAELASGAYPDKESAMAAAEERAHELGYATVPDNPLVGPWMEGMLELGRLMRRSLGLPDSDLAGVTVSRFHAASPEEGSGGQ